MSGVRGRGLPAIPGLARFPELNVRTYVNLNGKPGVYFFSLDAAHAPAVWAARTFYHLPYFFADMNASSEGEEIKYTSTRPEGQAAFKGGYAPFGTVRLGGRGTVEPWLTERYCLYTVYRERVYCGEIHHAPWPLQERARRDHGQQYGLGCRHSSSGRAATASLCAWLEVLIWPLRQVS